MKALILAAGLGTRLAPHTRYLPKPLFTLNNRPVLDLAIDRLMDAGCTRIFINTHHLADQIRHHIEQHPLSSQLTLVHEPEILDTGGAIANLKQEFLEDDFLVVNADIVHDLDLKPVIDGHREKRALATLVLHHWPEFNKISTAPDGRILNFTAKKGEGLAFTGLQVLSPEILDHLPEKPVFSSIELYAALCPTGRIQAHVSGNFFWQDMGTVRRYQETARLFLAGSLFGIGPSRFQELDIQPLAGDGSDRKWFRAKHQGQNLILSDHGICLPGSDTTRQLESFLRIGTHLNRMALPVPKILGHDRISGHVAVQDLGSIHLADAVAGQSEERVTALYRRVIDRLIAFSQRGINGFDPDWTCQTPAYSRQMILDLECRYFLEAFVRGYLGVDASWTDLEPAFDYLARQAEAGEHDGLMHRDFQSRNIMVRDNDIFFIDFQSARKGPLAYDLASLLIDPYVTLHKDVQEKLLGHCISLLSGTSGFDAARFRHQYDCCTLTRNLQMLGAFGFLTRVKNKSGFEHYIPTALAGLKRRLAPMAEGPLRPLNTLINTL